MSMELMIAILTQWANYLTLLGSYLAQIAAQMEFAGELDQAGEELAGIYNVLGNQITTIAAAIYCLLGQVAITQLVQASTDSANQDDENQVAPQEEVSLEASLLDTPRAYFRAWRIKKVKKLRSRRWNITQHYRRHTT